MVWIWHHFNWVTVYYFFVLLSHITYNSQLQVPVLNSGEYTFTAILCIPSTSIMQHDCFAYFRAETERGLSRKHIIEGIALFYPPVHIYNITSSLSACDVSLSVLFIQIAVYAADKQELVCRRDHVWCKLRGWMLCWGLRGSLQRLQLDYVDIVFANKSDPRTPMEGLCCRHVASWRVIWRAAFRQHINTLVTSLLIVIITTAMICSSWWQTSLDLPFSLN